MSEHTHSMSDIDVCCNCLFAYVVVACRKMLDI